MVLFDKIGLILFHFAWQATVIALISGFVLLLLKNANSRVRYAISCFSLLLMIVLPIYFTVSNFITYPYGFEASDIMKPAPVDAQEAFYGNVLVGITFRTYPIHISAFEELIYQIKKYTPFITIIWILGVLLITFYRIYGFLKIRILVKQAQTIIECCWETKIKEMMQKIGLKRLIKILKSPSIDTPVVIGFLKPVLIVPVSFFSGIDSTYIEAILLHELAHIKRFDYLVNIIQLVVETIGFFHPAVWWISNRIRRERENCCDDFAVDILCDKLIYVKSLVQLEEKRLNSSLVTAANGSSLSFRVSRLLGKKSDFYNSPFLNFTATFIVVLFLAASLGFVMSNSNDGKLLGNLFKNVTYKLDDNLVAYFPFNGNTNDKSVSKQKMFIHNVVLCEDRFGKKSSALDFNGWDSYIRTNKENEVNNAESITISSWIYPRRAKNWESWICKDGIKYASEWRIGFGENKNSEWGFTICNQILKRHYWSNYWITDSKIELNKWTHIAVTADQIKNIITVYMNGRKIGVLKNLRNYDKVEGAIRIGHQTDDNVYFDGKIDDVRIYNRVLSDEEVRAVYEIE
jgi:beta-lactamase regulating signal transducer with metallopeptidase domain